VKTSVFYLLATLRSGPQDANGILERLRGLPDTEASPSLAGFYRGVKRAADEGWIDVVAGDSDGAPGRPRQRYRLTAAGRSAVEAEARQMRRLAALVLGVPDQMQGRP